MMVYSWQDLFSSFRVLLGEPLLNTLAIMLGSTFLACLGGIPLGVYLVLTSPGYPLAAERLYGVASSVINILRSIPTIILVILISSLLYFRYSIYRPTDFALLLEAIVMWAIAAIPLCARLVESALKEVDKGLLEAAMACGATVRQLVRKVMLKEALPGLILGITTLSITILGTTVMSETIAIRTVASRAVVRATIDNDGEFIVSGIAILAGIITLVQTIGTNAARHADKSR
ncbi:MAG TPA: ABC transporter permease subunit [Bacillota bacterium]|nr:MAG: D-methionine transport system permease protein MetI [Firmicutes bacterium ADurb.Bin153]HNV35145.1 ABC transporter permease subunit [Bacillota bacterium]